MLELLGIVVVGGILWAQWERHDEINSSDEARRAHINYVAEKENKRLQKLSAKYHKQHENRNRK